MTYLQTHPVYGTTVHPSYLDQVYCPRCNSKGRGGRSSCGNCDGTGWVKAVATPEFGIGRIPADSDDAYELAKMVIAAPVASVSTKSVRREMTCRRCHQSGYRGEYPFSTDPSSGLCDDCY